MPAGRPTKYKAEYCEMLVKHMEEGLSFESFGAKANVSRDTLYTWEKKYEEFAEAKKKGKTKCLEFWESMGRSGAAGKLPGFNAAAWIFNMKNRFMWRDRQDVVTTDLTEKKNITESDLEKILNEKLKRREERVDRTARTKRSRGRPKKSD